VPSRFDLTPEGHEPIARDEARRFMPLSLVHQFQWSWGDGWGNWDDPERYDVMAEDSFEAMRERARQQCALIQTAWRIAAQVVRAPERPQRQLWRDANRKGIRHKDVTVIRLRRYAQRVEGDGEGGHLTVRFVVRGHWRNQWYATLQDHRQVWIAPYVKGPEDAPLKLTERAWEFVR
jgi:hypothetical protein